MALVHAISEPGEIALRAPAQSWAGMGIGLGTTNSLVAAVR